ncbi:MAG: hypothetical protein HY870_08930 [Chloroflexi bacterium]|nr:hypothetical protein [Chloroflexota bacterium]
MTCTVSNVCLTDFCTEDGCAETPPPELTAGALVKVGLGVTIFVGAGFGVLVGCGVAVDAGVAVAVGVTGVAVGGTGVLVAVGSSVAVGGTAVAVGSIVAVGGTGVGSGAGAAAVQAAANRLTINPNIINLPDSLDIIYLLENDPVGRRIRHAKRGDISP